MLNPEWPGKLAMESAASILGLSQRVPDQEVINLPIGYMKPKALDAWRVVHLAVPDQGTTTIDGMHAWSANGLLAGIAKRPGSYKDLA